MSGLLSTNRMIWLSDKCSVLCFTETWLNESIPDSALQQLGFSLFRADRTSSSLKWKGGGVCFYVNQCWCTDTKIISMACSTNLELHTIKCRHFYLPRDFTSVILVAVFIPPQAAAADCSSTAGCSYYAVRKLISRFDGDFNYVDLRKTMPRFIQQITALTRGNKILDQCYSVFPNAFHSVSWAPLFIIANLNVFRNVCMRWWWNRPTICWRKESGWWEETTGWEPHNFPVCSCCSERNCILCLRLWFLVATIDLSLATPLTIAVSLFFLLNCIYVNIKGHFSGVHLNFTSAPGESQMSSDSEKVQVPRKLQ